MRSNKLREIWADGGTVINGWLSIPNAFSAEIMANQGWDSVTIDTQHGMIDFSRALEMLIGISTTDAVPMARAPWLEPGILMKLLDAGAYGIICPMINTVEDAENLARFTHYAPQGARSFGPLRASLYAGGDYAEKANDSIVVFAMIETKQAVENLEGILAVPGIDAVYIGPSDLSLSLGCKPVLDDVEKPVSDAIDYILAKTKEHGKVAGIHNGTTQSALMRAEKGFQFVTIATDARLLAVGAQQVVKEMRNGGKPAEAEKSSGGYI